MMLIIAYSIKNLYYGTWAMHHFVTQCYQRHFYYESIDFY